VCTREYVSPVAYPLLPSPNEQALASTKVKPTSTHLLWSAVRVKQTSPRLARGSPLTRSLIVLS
jgi:hypothetical protein